MEAGAIGQKLMCHLSLCFSTHMMCQAKVRHMGCICVPARNFHPLTFPTFYPACSVHLLQRVFLHPVPNPALHMPVRHIPPPRLRCPQTPRNVPWGMKSASGEKACLQCTQNVALTSTGLCPKASFPTTPYKTTVTNVSYPELFLS